MNDRLRQFIEYAGLTTRQFEQRIGASDGQIAKFLRRDTSVQATTLAKIKANFPQLSMDWLLTGQGAMLHAAPAAAEPGTPLPLIPFEALAGLPAADNPGVSFADCEQYVVPDFAARGADFLIRVSGTSMIPTYHSGDLLACAMIKDILFFQWGKVYVIDSSQGVLVKRVRRTEREGHISLVSDNADQYPPFDFPVSDIRSLAIVAGVIRLE